MVLRSPYPDVAIPAVSLSEYVLGGAAERGDKPALIDGASGAVTTYAEFAGQVDRAAAGLAAEGIGPGDAVGLLGAEQPGVGGRLPRRVEARRDRHVGEPAAHAARGGQAARHARTRSR